MKQEYFFYTIDASKLINGYCKCDIDKHHNKVFKFEFSFENTLARADVIKSYDTKANCALFDQIQLTKDNNFDVGNVLADASSLEKDIVFVDFSSIGDLAKIYEQKNSTSYKKLADFLRYGFSIKYDDSNIIKYSHFDHSDSMTRHSQISFIRQDIRQELDQRLMLDIDTQYEMGCVDSYVRRYALQNMSKYYSYRGKYLSTSDRINGLKLNEETVIIIDDDTCKTQEVPVITSCTDTKTTKLVIHPFDGEGLISPAYASKINKFMKKHYGQRDDATGFQVRLPFGKGMLHTVDFHDFFKSYFTNDNVKYEDLYIKDAYGFERQLCKAEIILTEGQFKCYKLLKSMQDDLRDKNYDVIKYYFDRLNKYNHALYVIKTNLNLKSSSQFTPYSYQFVNTLDISTTEFDKLVKSSIEQFILEEKIDLTNITEQQSIAINNFIRDNKGYAWASAIELNKQFLGEKKVKDTYKVSQLSYLKNVAKGKFKVQGEDKFLSRDLVALLMHAAKQLSNASTFNDNIVAINSSLMYSDFFYAPSEDSPLLEANNYYAIYRSPHYSRNETCAMKPHIAKKAKCTLTNCNGEAEEVSLYDKYLSHLGQTIMIAYKSYAANTLGGADFDGDEIKLIFNMQLNKAVLSGAYEKNEKNKYERVLPIIDIEDEKSKTTVTNALISYNQFIEAHLMKYICIAFSSQVGIISNNAILLGKDYYAKKLKLDNNENPMALIAIIGGREIDSPKTGLHPSLAPINKYLDDRSSANDYFFKMIKKGSSFDEFNNRIKWDVTNKDGVTTFTPSKDDANIKIEINDFDENAYNIDNLPSYFAKYYESSKINLKTSRASDDHPRFKYQLDDYSIDENDEQMKKVIALISTYKCFNAWQANDKKTRSRSASNSDKYFKAVKYILGLKYDSFDYELCEGYTITRIFNEIIELVFSFANKNGATKKEKQDALTELLKRLIENRWQFLGDNKIELAKLLNTLFETEKFTSDDADYNAICELLFDFRVSGYKMLYFIIQYFKNEIGKADTNEDEDTDFDESNADATLFAELKHIYCTGVKSKATFATINKRLKQAYRKKLKDAFGVDENGCINPSAIMYCDIAKKKHDKNGTFFWEILNEDEILPQVVTEVDNA